MRYLYLILILIILSACALPKKSGDKAIQNNCHQVRDSLNEFVCEEP